MEVNLEMDRMGKKGHNEMAVLKLKKAIWARKHQQSVQ